MKVSKIIKNFFGHLTTINEHRFLVMKHCFRVGLYKQGLTHDLSKYSPTEFIPGVKYFQGDRSPIMHSVSMRGIHQRGFIIKEETDIIMNIG